MLVFRFGLNVRQAVLLDLRRDLRARRGGVRALGWPRPDQARRGHVTAWHRSKSWRSSARDPTRSRWRRSCARCTRPGRRSCRSSASRRSTARCSTTCSRCSRSTPTTISTSCTPHQTLTQITTRVLERHGAGARRGEARRRARARRHDDEHRRRARGLLSADPGRARRGGSAHDDALGALSRGDEPPADRARSRRTTSRRRSRARTHLEREHVDPNDIFVTGNTVIDAFLETAARAEPRASRPNSMASTRARPLDLRHGAPAREPRSHGRHLRRAAPRSPHLPQRPQILWPVHPSPQVAPVAHDVLDGVEGVRLVAPMTYDATVRAIARCAFVLTDSGGLQEEAPCLGKPVLVMRDETERPEGIEAGTLRARRRRPRPDRRGGPDAADDEVAYARMARASNPYGDGQAAPRIVAWLLARLRGGAPTGGIHRSGRLAAGRRYGLRAGFPAGRPKLARPRSAAELRAYYARKRSTVVWSLVCDRGGVPRRGGGSRRSRVSRWESVACAGSLNALLTMRSTERLVDHRSVGSFVFSSLLRIVVFGIVPVDFALHGPWWSMATYFAGFFLPLALYAVRVASRTSERVELERTDRRPLDVDMAPRRDRPRGHDLDDLARHGRDAAVSGVDREQLPLAAGQQAPDGLRGDHQLHRRPRSRDAGARRASRSSRSSSRSSSICSS